MDKKLNANNIMHNFQIILAFLAKYFAIFSVKQWDHSTGHCS